MMAMRQFLMRSLPAPSRRNQVPVTEWLETGCVIAGTDLE